MWQRTWVLVGHVSEIPNPHDIFMKSIRPDPVLMTLDKDGQVHLLHNRCPHRGNQRCFTCNYHDWNFGIDGSYGGYQFPPGSARDRQHRDAGRRGRRQARDRQRRAHHDGLP